MEIMETKMGDKKSWVTILIDGISGIFMPIVNLLSAAGILKGILIILITVNLLSEQGSTYLILNAMADAVFYFLPIILAVTAAKKFGADPYLAAVIGAVLLYPALTQAMSEGSGLTFLTIPVRSVQYASSVLPIIMAVGMLKYAERLFGRFIPELVKGFVVPLCCIVSVSLMTLFMFGPIGAVVGDVLAFGYESVYRLSPILAGAILGAVIQPMVIFGFHWSFILVAMNNISLRKTDTVMVLMAPAVFAQAGAAMAVFVKSKDKNFRSLCLSASLSALFGITEPAMFGVNLPLKKPMIAVCIGGGLGGAIAGVSGVSAATFALPSLAAMSVYFGRGFGMFAVGCAAAFIAAFAAALVMKYDAELTS